MRVEVPARKVELRALRFRACASHQGENYHADCPDCVIVEDLGRVSRWHSNVFVRAWWRLEEKLDGIRRSDRRYE